MLFIRVIALINQLNTQGSYILRVAHNLVT
jgi:hypothetical protein